MEGLGTSTLTFAMGALIGWGLSPFNFKWVKELPELFRSRKSKEDQFFRYASQEEAVAWVGAGKPLTPGGFPDIAAVSLEQAIHQWHEKFPDVPEEYLRWVGSTHRKCLLIDWSSEMTDYQLKLIKEDFHEWLAKPQKSLKRFRTL